MEEFRIVASNNLTTSFKSLLLRRFYLCSLISILLTLYRIVINSEGTFSSIVCDNKDYIRCCYNALLSLQLFKWFQHSDPLLFSYRQCIHVHRWIIVLHLMISIHLKILRFPQCIGLKWFSTKSFKQLCKYVSRKNSYKTTNQMTSAHLSLYIKIQYTEMTLRRFFYATSLIDNFSRLLVLFHTGIMEFFTKQVSDNIYCTSFIKSLRIYI